MSRILFVISPERGHINQFIGPAHYLQKDRKNIVAFYCQYNIADRIKRAGFSQFFSAKQESPPPVTANKAKYFAENIKDKEWSRFSLKTAYLDRVPMQLEPLRQTIRDFVPHVVIVDPKIYEAAIVCEQEKIKWMTMSASLTMVSPDFLASELNDTVKWFKSDREQLLKTQGVSLNFRFTDCLSPLLNVCFTTDDLLGNVTFPEVKRLGPSIPPSDRGDECEFPWRNLDESVPAIYVWLGSQTFYQPGIMRTLIDAVRDRGVQLVCAVSELYDTLKLEAIPDNVLLLKDVPQLNILPAMAGMVSHGGATSVMESLANGVPILVNPFYDDHSHQAYFIDKCGVGQRQDLSKMDTGECWRALQFILESPRIKEAVDKVQFSYKKKDGAHEAAMLVSRML
jgi:zeaxanthin glucosyltransferase